MSKNSIPKRIKEIADYVKHGSIHFRNGKYGYWVSTSVRRSGEMIVRKTQIDKAVSLGLISKEDVEKINQR